MKEDLAEIMELLIKSETTSGKLLLASRLMAVTEKLADPQFKATPDLLEPIAINPQALKIALSGFCYVLLGTLNELET